MTDRVSLAELALADIHLRPAEAVAVVVEVCRQYCRGVLRGIPSPGVIRLARDGQLIVEGPMTTEEGGVTAAAQLLEELLADFDAPAEYRASGGLRLVIARALGTLDLPRYQTVEELSAALTRFAAPDLAGVARDLFRSWASGDDGRRSAASARPLTISDIRRARRATGLSLDDLSAVADVPASRLRELEWGYLRNWRPDATNRASVLRYARAAGLDESLVLSIAWPMIQEASADLEPERQVVTTLVPAGPQAVVTVEPIAAPKRQSVIASWGLAAVAAALMGLATLQLAGGSVPALTLPPAVAETSPQADNLPALEPAVPVEPAVAAAPAISARATAAPPARHGLKRPPVRRVTHPRSFFKREVFRIVFR